MTINEQKAEKMKEMEPESETEETVSEAEDEIPEAEEKNENPAETEEAAGEAEKQDDDLNTKYIRLMADFQNFRKRTEKQKSEIHAYANEKIVLELIQVMDNFERALMMECENEKGFKEGMEMIFVQLKDVLKNTGVTEIEAYDVEFDPNFHNAVMMEDTDKVESGKVSEVLQKGYILNGKVVRPSMVKVAR